MEAEDLGIETTEDDEKVKVSVYISETNVKRLNDVKKEFGSPKSFVVNRALDMLFTAEVEEKKEDEE